MLTCNPEKQLRNCCKNWSFPKCHPIKQSRSLYFQHTILHTYLNLRRIKPETSKEIDISWGQIWHLLLYKTYLTLRKRQLQHLVQLLSKQNIKSFGITIVTPIYKLKLSKCSWEKLRISITCGKLI